VVPINPDLGDATVDFFRVVFASAQPAEPVTVDPASVTTINTIPGDTAIHHNPSDVPGDPTLTINLVHTALASVVPTDLAPIDPDPVNPSSITMDDCTPAAHALIDCTHITFASPTLIDSIPALALTSVMLASPVLDKPVPADPVPVDPEPNILINPIDNICTALAGVMRANPILVYPMPTDPNHVV
jgi:hypothetical protein